MIKDTLKNAIRSLSKRHSIGEKELRICISKPEKDLKYDIMKNGVILETTNIATALNLNSMTAFAVSMKLNSVVGKISRDYNIPENRLNVRIYTKTDDCEPLLYLFDDKTAKESLDLDELI